MKRVYAVYQLNDTTFEVIRVTTIYGERISAYESEPSRKEQVSVFKGSLSDCYAYIKLCKDGESELMF